MFSSAATVYYYSTDTRFWQNHFRYEDDVWSECLIIIIIIFHTSISSYWPDLRIIRLAPEYRLVRMQGLQVGCGDWLWRSKTLYYGNLYTCMLNVWKRVIIENSTNNATFYSSIMEPMYLLLSERFHFVVEFNTNNCPFCGLSVNSTILTLRRELMRARARAVLVLFINHAFVSTWPLCCVMHVCWIHTYRRDCVYFGL